MNGLTPPSKNYYKIFDTRLSTVRVEKPLYDNGFEAYQDKLLLSAEHYHNQGIICFPTYGKKPLPGFTYRNITHENFTFKDCKNLFTAQKENINGLAILGGYVPQQNAYSAVIDIDNLSALEKLLKTKMGKYFNTTKVSTYRGFHFYYVTSCQVKGYKVLYFEGEKVGEFRGAGSYWIAPPSEFWWEDKNGGWLPYRYKLCGQVPMLKLEEKDIREIFEFCQVKNRTIIVPGEAPFQETTEQTYQVAFLKEITGYERVFSWLGWSGLCPFHQETHSSFGFYTAENGKMRAKDHHNGESYSMPELFIFYPNEPAPRGVPDKPREEIPKQFYKLLVGVLERVMKKPELVEGFIFSEPVKNIIQGKRKANRKGYLKAFIFIFGLVLLRREESFLLPIELMSLIIGVSRMQGLKFLKQIEAEGIIKAVYKRRAKNSDKNRVWEYRKSKKLRAFLSISKVY